jgi:hypothetical protein
MGTNFSRIPTVEEMEERKEKLLTRIKDMELTSENIERAYGYIPKGTWDQVSPWGEFIEDSCIHLGKRSGGWKFVWNFHDNKYYSNKEELFKFIRSGRVVDEYGKEIEVEEFIEMALNWGEPDGHVFNEEYVKTQYNGHFWGSEHFDRTIDGLNVSSSTDFS